MTLSSNSLLAASGLPGSGSAVSGAAASGSAHGRGGIASELRASCADGCVAGAGGMADRSSSEIVGRDETISCDVQIYARLLVPDNFFRCDLAHLLASAYR